MNRLFTIVMVAFVFAISASAQSTEEQYVRIYNLIQQADGFNTSGKPQDALHKYLDAQTALQRLQKVSPDWNPKVVNFRLGYVSEKISSIVGKPGAPVESAVEKPVAAATTAAPVTPVADAASPAPDETVQQLNALQEQLRRLATERTILEAKLKEAFATQPAAIDPRELQRAGEKIQALTRENESLKSSLAAEKEKPAATANPKQHEEAKRELAEIKKQLADQTAQVNSLANERAALIKKIERATAAEEDAAAAKLALKDANRRLSEQDAILKKLAEEKTALETRSKTTTASTETVENLRAENTLLKKQLAEANAVPPGTDARADVNARQLAQAQARIALLQSDTEVLRLEKSALEDRLRKKPIAPETATIVATDSRSRDTRRIKQLETERDDLKKRLTTANTELATRNSSNTSGKLNELDREITALRAKVEVFEARAVPYTAEELALFKASGTELSASVSGPATSDSRKPTRTLPPGAAALANEAQKFFATREFDKAEARYLEILKQDENNVYTLANLAAIQMEMGKFDAAEQNVKKAIAGSPDDAYTLSILGYLKFRQEKYDDALDALSRAVKLNPQSAEVQNYLGVTLSHKGQRGPAETALRKAIQIDPNYGKAHNNLAVIYVSQTPPLVQLARWHYQKALACGHERNPELEKMLEKPAPKTP
ncbi:MAG: tetratricopeptide repeat protein [Verrucomicrobia bacterium]|nr:tetratricopeptide repeat protein [Verrucomicrobiota bacterium]